MIALEVLWAVLILAVAGAMMGAGIACGWPLLTAGAVPVAPLAAFPPLSWRVRL